MTKWKHTVGTRPNTVRVFEREAGGPLYVRIWDPTMGVKGAYRKRSLGHKDKTMAMAHAAEEYARLLKGEEDLVQGRVTLAQVFALYSTYRTPRKTESEQKQDERRTQMWQAWLGTGSDPHTISLREWEGFISARASGEITARGFRTDDLKPVRHRTVEADCDWLRTVFSWAVDWRSNSRAYLMHENPVRGYSAPAEKNPRRAVATQDRFEIVRAVSDEFGYLSEILDLANDTGRRISSICKLLYSDLIVNDNGKFVSIRWRAETDKTGHESIIPITDDAGAALARVQQFRPGIGDTHIFPAPGNPQRPISRHLADSWLRKAEKKAGLSPQDGSLWHAYRRKWVTERKHLPDVDVAAAGGWQNTDTLKLAYQHADQETIRQVVMEPRRLREAL